MRLRLLLTSLLIISLLSSLPFTRAQSRRQVSLLLFNGKVFTADARGTIAEAVAVEGERIVAVGSTQDLRARYEAAREIDLQGKLMTPGFNDAHLHLMDGGFSLMRVDLGGAKTLDEALSLVAARIRELPPGSWVLGRGWDHTLWGNRWPTRQDLDKVSPNNPVWLYRVDGHIGWANSLALQKAGVTRETKVQEGGEMLRDASGEPTGILKEQQAYSLVEQAVPAPSREEKIQAIERALHETSRYGITSITNFFGAAPATERPGYEMSKLYRELIRQDKFPLRVSIGLNFENPVEELKRQREEFATFKDDPHRLRLGPVKGYVDGTLGSRTAAMLAPYTDDPHNSGIPRRTPEELTRMILERDEAGFQIALHAIGDRANRMSLDGYERADKIRLFEGMSAEPGSRGARAWLRHRIEHAQVVAPTDFARFRNIGVIASMQPSHAISDKRWAQDRLGEYRVQGAYAWRMMQAFGVHMAFGTDWPFDSISPYVGLYAAVTRQSEDGDPPGGWWPQERVSIAEAIRCYTTEGAYATFEEKEKGQLAAGMLADMTVHSRDLLTIKPEEILQTETVLTILGGKVIYEK
ncbi:MAG: amidohydrolase [Acidobacteria bacterium]|nr:amidohydrolase [Acidobacteriota bacterium]